MIKEFGLGIDDPIATPSAPAAPSVATELLSGLRPRIAARPQSPLIESDENAKKAGFTSREPNSAAVVSSYTRPTRQRRKQEQTFPLSMRTPESILRRFIAYAEKHKLSYPLALEKLLDESESRTR